MKFDWVKDDPEAQGEDDDIDNCLVQFTIAAPPSFSATFLAQAHCELSEFEQLTNGATEAKVHFDDGNDVDLYIVLKQGKVMFATELFGRNFGRGGIRFEVSHDVCKQAFAECEAKLREFQLRGGEEAPAVQLPAQPRAQPYYGMPLYGNGTLRCADCGRELNDGGICAYCDEERAFDNDESD